MGAMFRSEQMQLSQLFLHIDSAYMCIVELGELGVVQFRDTNAERNAFQRKFVNEVRRCDEMERKLRFMLNEIQANKLKLYDSPEVPESPAPREMIDMETTFEKLENETKEVNASIGNLRQTYFELQEMKHLLRKTQIFFDEAYQTPTFATDENLGLLGEEGGQTTYSGAEMHLGSVAGVILRENLPAFERMLWRACSGNVFLKQAEIELPIEDLLTGEEVYKTVFIIFFQGDQLKMRVTKICEGFHATIYPCPESAADRRTMLIDVVQKIDDLETVLTQTQQHRQRILEAAAKNLNNWFIRVRKMKAIYHTLNLFDLDVTTKCMIGECWCAVSDLDQINLALCRGMQKSGSTIQPILNVMPTKDPPPTFHRTDKFTEAFQGIVDAYGVATYREVNPALFTLITFPFLFAVMFGDAGHGLVMFLFGLWMALWERRLIAMKIKDEVFDIFFGGRYVILLMGAFSIYTGVIYNDIFSKSANLFGSSWYPGYDKHIISSKSLLQLEPRTSENITDQMFAGQPYPFGIDPVWQISNNKIPFMNSLKMKISIILAVLHMMFGVILSFFNHKFFNNTLSIWCEALPQLLFLASIFGYLVIIIFYKWGAYTADEAATAPSLLLMLINMFRFNYEVKGGAGDPFYGGQAVIQSLLMLVALVCIPWMLLSKPLILRWRFKRSVDLNQSTQPKPTPPPRPPKPDFSDASQGNGGSKGPDTDSAVQVVTTDDHDGSLEHFNFGECMVYSAIHTIEYCLGCISNTASYLRLWALSLAHAQLSEVLWSMVMQIGLKIDAYYGSVLLFLIFAAWAGLTVGVLVMMEGLSAFLHAIRLHWVEFQNKFYSGTGYLFEPFSFKAYINLPLTEP
ncbi:V-type proton ATPase subunit [Echinococcus granulosus]|uniref:V-type proton ATPase subunit a n=1 Tax=Echinococcus granulosus TaxID=6210 RepID=A0A068WKD5_ECHGR|nr:V-type proton ATPase subunit [Echinococcus granulosus]CDS18138.1 V type proton ATPase 116 kDa subunit a [Echinococcus granulosus]